MIEDLQLRLADQMERLASDLLGTIPTSRSHDEIRFGQKGSLAVRVAGPKRGTFCDFSCDAKGDAVSLIRHVHQCGTREAILWAQQWLGNAPSSPAPLRPPASPPAASEGPSEPPRTIKLARSLWRESAPAEGTVVGRYLHSRGLALEPGMPIRFHPRAWRKSANGPPGPAMISLMTSPEAGEPRGVHVTYLKPDGAGKAEGPTPKIMFGKAGVIRLAPLEGPALGIAEGIETALAVMQHAGWRPVWAATCAGAVGRFPIILGAASLSIFADADPPGMAAAREAAQRWRNAGKAARIIAPRSGDWADALKSGANG